MQFSEWLRVEMKRRDLGVRELARAAGVSPAGISKILNEYRGAGPEICVGIARALDLPPEEVFRKAGLLPDRPAYDVRERRALFMFDLLSAVQQEHILELMRSMVEREETEKA